MVATGTSVNSGIEVEVTNDGYENNNDGDVCVSFWLSKGRTDTHLYSKDVETDGEGNVY